MWLEYYHKWASGLDSEKHYIEIEPVYLDAQSNATIHDFISDYDICKENEWSDKYRGVNYEIVEKPPTEWIKKRIEDCKNAITSYQRSIVTYQQMLKAGLDA